VQNFRDPPEPLPPTPEQIQLWRSWPLVLREAIPLGIVREYVEFFGDPLGRTGPDGVPLIDNERGRRWRFTTGCVSGGQSRELWGDVCESTSQLATIRFEVYTLGLCGIERMRRNECKGLAWDDPRFWEQIGSTIGQAIGSVLTVVSQVFSIIPGIGQGIGAALAVAGGLAAGKPIDQVMLDAAANAIPGGPLIKSAVQTGAGAVGALLSGRDVGEALVAGGREFVVAQGGELAGAAYDVGVAIAQGKQLQDAGFASLRFLTKGNGLAERGLNFAQRAAQAAREGRTVEELLVDELGSDVRRAAGGALQSQLDPLVGKVVRNPSLLGIDSGELAVLEGVSEAVARAAQAVARTGQIDEPLRERLLRTATAKVIENVGLKAAVTQHSTYADAVSDANRYANVTGSSALIRNQGTYRDAVLERAAPNVALKTALLASSSRYSSPKPPPPPAVTTTVARPATPRNGLASDVALGLTIAAAGGALLWFYKRVA